MNAEGQRPIADCVRLACLLECTARKPGNVHPDAAFDDLCRRDFVRSADVIAPILAKTRDNGIGPTIHAAVAATQGAVGKNTNLGIILLLAPPAAVPRERPLSEGLPAVLQSLTREDAEWVYRAIRLAQPGGMGHVDQGDVSAEPTGTLLEMMLLAADRDAIAAQYATGFDLVLNFGLPILDNQIETPLPGERAAEEPQAAQPGEGNPRPSVSTRPDPPLTPGWEEAIIRLHLELMAKQPDTLIARKCGPEVAVESASRAKAILDAGWPQSDAGREQLAEFDRWLRADSHRRNPGTTADLVTATLFAAFREGLFRESPG